MTLWRTGLPLLETFHQIEDLFSYFSQDRLRKLFNENCIETHENVKSNIVELVQTNYNIPVVIVENIANELLRGT